MDNEEKIELEQLQLKYTEQKKAIACGVLKTDKAQRGMQEALQKALLIMLLIFSVISIINYLFGNKQMRLSIMTSLGILAIIVALLIVRFIQWLQVRRHKDVLVAFGRTERKFQILLKELFEKKFIKILEEAKSSMAFEVKVRVFLFWPNYIKRLPELFVRIPQNNKEAKKEKLLFKTSNYKLFLKSAELKYYHKGIKGKINKPKGWYIVIKAEKIIEETVIEGGFIGSIINEKGYYLLF